MGARRWRAADGRLQLRLDRGWVSQVSAVVRLQGSYRAFFSGRISSDTPMLSLRRLKPSVHPCGSH